MEYEAKRFFQATPENLPRNSVSIVGLSSRLLVDAYSSPSQALTIPIVKVAHKPFNLITLNPAGDKYRNIDNSLDHPFFDANTFACYDSSTPVIALLATPNMQVGMTTYPIDLRRIITTFDIQDISKEEAAKAIKEHIDDNSGRIKRVVRDSARLPRPRLG